MADLQVFGSWERDWVGQGPIYVITARCSPKCHQMRWLVTPEEVERLIVPDAMWDSLEHKFRDAFARVHG